MSRYKSRHTGATIDDAIDRAKAGGEIDALLAGKAPAGYGLGGAAKYLTADDDLNNIWQAGWYAWDAPPKNAPTIPAIGMNGYYCSMLVMNKGGSYTFEQIVVSIDGFVFFRNVVGGASEEWDILNPPMYAGVEFRTTERHLGKPVYVKTLSFGALPNATTKSIDTGINNTYALIDRSVYTINNGGYSVVDMNRFELEDKFVAGSASWGYYVTATSDFSAYTTTYVTFKYTKD